MRNLKPTAGRAHGRVLTSQRRFAWVGLITILTLILSFFPQVVPGAPVPTASAHNLDASAVYVYFDPNTQAKLDARMNGLDPCFPSYTPPAPLLRGPGLCEDNSLFPGDELGLIIKALPDNGTTTGVGGYTTYYVPNGLQVTDAAILMPGDLVADGITGYDKVPAKGQAQMPAVGAGGGPTTSLVGITRGPNILGVTSPIVTAANANLGTLPGVYGDTGIFYSTASETAYGSWTDGTMTNNSGDTVGLRTLLGTPLNKWDAWQMQAFGTSGFANAAYSDSPIIDSNGRGYAPWGLANVVAGPQSGYAWEFDWDTYKGCDTTPTTTPDATCIDQATRDIGPWQRIKYPGSQFADDPPGANPPVQPYTRGQDASGSGFDLTAGDLAATTGQANGTPNAIRFAFGQLTYNSPEYAWVKVKVNNPAAILDATGCPVWTVDTFGGDAGGDSGGKDHIWRYYDPNSVTFNGCLAVGKPANKELVKVGENFQYKIKVYNMGNGDLANVIVKDTLPSGVTYVSAVPAPTTLALPNLTWNVGALLQGDYFEALVTVKASSSGVLNNTVIATGTKGGTPVEGKANEKTVSGSQVLLRQAKEVSPSSVAPGGTVNYTIRMTNVGSGPSGSPVVITEYLPSGFTYSGAIPGSVSATVNGATVTALVSGTAAQPIFSVPSAINAGYELVLSFPANVSNPITAANYCNSFKSTQGGINLLTGAQACVDVGGGTIGDTLYRDWDGDGLKDPEDEGLAGVVMELQNGTCTPGSNCPTVTTDANGFYQFTGLTAGTYTVKVLSGVPAGYTQKGDPDETGVCVVCNGQSTVTLAANEKKLDRDFGYKPGGSGSIGDTVFDDQGNDGTFNGADVGIPNVTVNLYEDTNGNGVVDAGDALIGTTQTGAGGVYGFSLLAEGLSYVVDVDQADPDIATYFGAGVIQQSTVDPRPVQGLTGAYTTADFGFYKVVPGSIGDKVWYDADADGVVDATEAGLAYVDVKLFQDANGNGAVDAGEPLLATTTTDANGVYSFNNLPAGTYVVDVVENDPDVPASLAPTRDPIAVTLGVAENKTDVDFPFVQALTKSVDLTSATPGQQLTYTVYPRYFGSDLLTGVVVNDTIPAGTTYDGSINAGGEAVDEDEIPDGVIDFVAWDLGSNDVGSVGYSGGTAMCPATQTIVASKDTYIDSGDINANYGTANTIAIDFDRVYHGLVQFTLPTLPTGAVLDKAELLLTVAGGQNAARTVSVRKLLKGPWTEGTSNNQCSTGAAWQGPNCADFWTSGNFGSSDYGPQLGAAIAPATSGATYATVITSAVNDWYTTPSANYGLVLLAAGSDTGTVTFDARNQAGTEPRLLLTYREPRAGGCSGTATLTDIADTYIQEDDAAKNYGEADFLKVRPQSTKRKHALLKFDVAGIPVGATLSAATLKVTVTTNRTLTTSEVHGMVTAWTEGTNSNTNGATWNDPDGSSGVGTWAATTFGTGDYNATTVGTTTPSTKGAKTIDVKSLVLGWQTGAVANNGLVLLTTGTATGDAAYASRENGTAANRPVINVIWTIPPANPTRVNTLSAGPLLVVEGDKITVKMVLQNTTASAVTNVAPSALTVTASGVGGEAYSCATLTGPSPASQTVPANGSATFTWSCTTNTAPTLPSNLAFSATASGDGSITWASSSSESVIVTPPLTFKAQVKNPVPAGVNVATNQADMTLAFPSTQGSVCYVMADGFDTNDVDYLRQVDRVTGAITPANPAAAGTQSIEGMTWSLDFTTLYAVNANQFGTLNTTTGLFSAKASTIASATDPMQGEFGAITVADVDGISFDPATGVLYGVHRREATNTQLDVLIKIDPVTGKHINSAFGTGVDYIKIDTSTLALYEIDDISFDPVSGSLYAVANGTSASPSVGDRLVTINKSTGAVTDVARITKSTGGNLDDVEGLSFFGDGALFATSGYHAATGDTNKLWYLDKDTAIATERAVLGTQTTYNDYEAVACRGGTLSTASTPSNPVETALTASIGDRVWSDVDGDGVQDDGEPGLAGVEVCVASTTNCDTTDAFGNYRIFGLTHNTSYNVTLTPGTIPDGTTPTTATTLTRTATTTGVTDADFGLRPPGTASIGDTVWLDANSNGSLDGAEQGLPNITVKLYIDQNNDGLIDGGDTLIRTTTTDAFGNYLFTGLHPDDYLVDVDTASTVDSPYDLPSNPNPTIAAAMAPTTGTTDPRDVTITTVGQAITNADFGYNWSGSIGDTVWYDTDQGQDVDGTEDLIPDATVLLYWDADNSGAIEGAEWSAIAFMDTDALGNYLFDNLPPGNYLVDVYEDSITSDGNRDIVPTTPNIRDVDLAAGQNVDSADFGYYKGALVQGNVFWDEDRNGVLDAGERDASHLLENVTVNIVCYGADGVAGGGDDYSGATSTDGNGHFKFIVPPGPCTVSYVTTDPDIPATLGDTTTPTSYSFTAEAGEDWHPSFDFGVDHSGKIGDLVWNDPANPGVVDAGEAGIANVTMYLCTTSPCSSANASAVTTTDANGKYLFSGLPDGPYYVAVGTASLPANFAATWDSDAPTTDHQSTATITGGVEQLGEDFGYKYSPPGGASLYTIGGLVYNDLDGDGDPYGPDGLPGGGDDEPGFANVDVTVVCTLGTNPPVTYVRQTSATGAWALAGIAGGSVCTALDADETDLPRRDYAATETPATSITVNNDISGLDFGYNQRPGSLSGTVCATVDSNGLCAAGESGLAPVVVTLYWAGPDGIMGTGDDSTTTQTTVGGNYSFANLQPGLYQVVETNLPGYTSTADRDGGNPDNITVLLALDQDAVDQDFEDLQLASVSGYVFEDLNLDGDRDPGEPPIANVPVTLRDGAGTPIATVNTDALGYYEFTDLQPGSYRITEANLPNYISTGDADGATNTADRIDVTLASGDNRTQQNFGDVRPGSIAGVVFNDANNNGVQDGGEGPLANVNVCATPVGGGAAICDLTDGTGAYLIPNVPPGNYTVTETNPGSYLSTTPDTLPVSVGSGQNVTNVNYGDELPVANTYSIAGKVCVNVNGDGTCDTNEAPLPGVTVKLYSAAGAVIATTTTGAAGDYLFVNVPNGTYSVVETDPPNHTSVNDKDGGTDNTIAVTVASANVTGRDFVDAAQTGGLAGKVYEDLNLNGQRDAGEPGIQGVTVTLTKPDNSTVTDTTDVNGDYAFPNLAPGAYTLTETDLAGYISTGDVDGPNDNKIVATVPAGVTVTGRDFGDVELGSIRGAVWDDANLNGVRDIGEGPLANVTVCAVPVVGAPLCDLTDGTGAYLIPNVPPGAYTVTEVDPAGYVSTTPNSVGVTVPSGGTATVDYGDVLPNPALGSISGTVCENVNGDGVCDPTEAPLAGVTVELWLVGGGSSLYSTTTDVNGDYGFPNLPAGSYRVEEVNLPNYVSVNDADGTAGNSADEIYPIPINGNVVTGRDFVDTPAPGSLSGKVCDDLDRDGGCEAGEPGIDGVTVKLYDSGGALVGTQTTAGGGLYAFPNLPPDTYTVVETDPANYQSTGDVYGANDNLIVATVPAGTAVPGQNFADAREPGAITGVVYSDLNADGNYDPGEPGLPNLQVCLTPPSGPQVCTTTNAGGQYAFTGLPPGNYTVTEPTDPTGYVSTGDADGAGNGLNTIAVTVPAGVTVIERDFFDHEKAVIGVAKRVVGTPVNNGNGSYDVTYEILVENMGLVVLSSVQVTDSLSATFAHASSFSLVSLATSANLHKNATYTGVPPAPAINLLTGADSLAPNAFGTITLVVRVMPGSDLGPYDNQAWATGTSPAGAKPTDRSQDGMDPDPGTPADGDPTNNNDPTPVSFAESPVIGVAKQVSQVTDNGDGTQNVTYILNLENLGDVSLINVQVMDDLAAAFTGATSFSVVSVSTSANLNKNTGYTGVAPNRGLLLGTDTLPVGGSGTITLVVKVTPGSKLGPYNNQATASADSQSGGITFDLSDDGVDPDPNNDGNPNETGENDPTPVTFTAKTQIGAAKDRGAVVNNGDGTYNVTYSIVVENLGSTVLTNVQVNDTLATTFPAPAMFSVVSVATSAGLNKNPGYTGSAPNTGLLLGTDTLNPGVTGTITLVVQVTPSTYLGPYNNQARASATGPGSVPTADNSDHGTDPDPNGNGNPNESGENDPTPVTFTEAPAIGIAKAVQSTTNNGDGTFTVVYALNVQNLGDIILNNVQVVDNLAVTFAGATSWSALVTSVSAGWTANASYTGSLPAPGINLLTLTGNSLAVGATKTIVLTVTVRPATNPATFNNQATATGVSPVGNTVTDLSQDGATIQPGVDSKTPVTLTQTPKIGLAKVVDSNTNNGDGSYTVVYKLRVQNVGDVALSNVQVVDPLSFFTTGGATIVSAVPTSTDFTVNDSYNSAGGNNLLKSTVNSLDVGAEGFITLTVKVIPGANLGPYDNTATASGFSPVNEQVTDVSQDGVDTDPDSGPGPSGTGLTPADNPFPGDDSTPTSVSFSESPKIGLAKRLVSNTGNGDGSYTVVYELRVQNVGDVPLSSVQVVDDLRPTFPPPASFSVTDLSSSSGASIVQFTVNSAGYNGSSDLNLLASGNTLMAKQEGLITLTVRVIPGAAPGPFDNTATASGISPKNAQVDDVSHDGTDTDEATPGVLPGDNLNPSDDRTPTRVRFDEDPVIGLAKRVKSAVSNGDGSFTVEYELLVQNVGDVPLQAVQVVDDLGAAFPAPASFTLVSVTSSSQFAVNQTYTGISPYTNLLLGTNTLAVNVEGTITIKLNVRPAPGVEPYTNQALASGVSPKGTPVDDVSQDGVDTDPDTPGLLDPADNSQPGDDSVPTLLFAAIKGAVWDDQNGDGNWDAGELGISGVTVTLTDGQTAITDAGGAYAFTVLPGTYTVTEVDPLGYLSTGDADGSGNGNNTIGPITVLVDETVVERDFFDKLDASYEVTKTLDTPGPLRINSEVIFTIRIKNTGGLPIVKLPLRDTYQKLYLSYGFNGDYSSRPSDDNLDDVPLDWTDLTQSLGHALAPNETVAVVVHFKAIKDTTGLSGGVTQNTATVHDATVDPDGTGPLPTVTLPASSASDTVQVVTPTGVGVSDFGGVRQGNKVTLTWRTAEEAKLAGFNIRRKSGAGEPAILNSELLYAQNAGANLGAAYSFVDPAAPAGVLTYVLEAVRLDGSVEAVGQIEVKR